MSKNYSVLVFGKNGQVGRNIVRILADLAVPCRATDIDEVDLTDQNAICRIIESEQPDWVINCAAHTAVDRAEVEIELSEQLNAHAPATMAACCAQLNSRFVHYSTDYVFSGHASSPYLETDSVDPQSVYGKTKLAGEKAVMAALPNAIIFRTAWVYSALGHNFVNTMVRLAGERSEISIVDDQIGSPTLADDLAQMSVNVIDKIMTENHAHTGGIFHATGGGQVSWYGFCKEIFRISNIDQVTVNPILTKDYPTPAPRPAYSVLSNEKLATVYGEKLPAWQESLKSCLSQVSGR